MSTGTCPNIQPVEKVCNSSIRADSNFRAFCLGLNGATEGHEVHLPCMATKSWHPFECRGRFVISSRYLAASRAFSPIAEKSGSPVSTLNMQRLRVNILQSCCRQASHSDSRYIFHAAFSKQNCQVDRAGFGGLLIPDTRTSY
jgi:hypothetical protein